MLGGLGITQTTTNWVYATTNYDPIAEMALEQLGYEVDWGEKRQAIGSGNRVYVDSLVEGMGRARPVLHLHGRVGWFRRDVGSGRIEEYAADVTEYRPDYGTPIVMLPNPKKAYDADGVVASLWAQFENALGRAKRVLVLGHSLNDDALTGALTRNVPSNRLAVSVLARPGPAPYPQQLNENDPVRNIATQRLSGAVIVPLRFGDPTLGPSEQLIQWAQRIAD